MTQYQQHMNDLMTRQVLAKEMRRTRKANVAQVAENIRLTDIRRAIEARIESKLLGAA